MIMRGLDVALKGHKGYKEIWLY